MNNPFIKTINQDAVYERNNTATYQGVTLKTFYFLLMTLVGAALGIFLLVKNPNALFGTLGISVFVGFISGLMAYRSPGSAKICGTIYCISEGLFLGTLCLLGELVYPGAVTIAVVTTVAVFAGMLALFASGIIRNKTGLYRFGAALGFCAIFVLLASLILSIIPAFRGIFANPGIMIGIELLILVYACVTLLMNFNEVTEAVKGGVEKSNEWICAFGLIFSILYIFLEVLRLVFLLFELFGDRS